ncbi:MAG: PstS family phosphate ABC transporter substrate-binding protein [Planctomycetes bacterium]|nr:PstS family phosphate ABC transporter substrate-binding protein [Planctomycetota bacterium]
MNLGQTLLTATLATSVFCASSAVAQVKVDPKLPKYVKTAGVSGKIKSVGSDTMNNLMALWGEGFERLYPNVQLAVEGKGSSTAPTALIAGAANFGPMSRAMKDKEVDDFEKKFGYKPTALRTAIDMLAVYVHRDNPIARQGLTLQQIDAIFSKTRKGGYPRDIKTWGDLGLEGDWANKPISLYGRNSASGTYGYFKENACFGGDYKDEVKEQPGSASVVQGVASDLYGIGYSGIGYKTADVATVALAVDGDSDHVPPTADSVDDYPLARFLFVYVNYKPNSQLDPLRAEFTRYIFSQEGQQDVIRDGYLPVTFAIAKKDLSAVGLPVQVPKK